MLEIWAMMLLCNKNKANALARGRKPGGFVGLTVTLWIGMELLGIVIGVAAELGMATYLLAILFAALGGLISYLIAKNCPLGNYVLPVNILAGNILQNAELLAQPARIDIVRGSSFVGAVVRWSFNLNGRDVGSLSNGQSLTVYTNQRQNILRATDSYGTEIAPLIFDIQNGSYAEVYFKANKFIWKDSKGIFPVREAEPKTPAEVVDFCYACGSKFAPGSMFCTKCGAKRFSGSG